MRSICFAGIIRFRKSASVRNLFAGGEIKAGFRIYAIEGICAGKGIKSGWGFMLVVESSLGMISKLVMGLKLLVMLYQNLISKQIRISSVQISPIDSISSILSYLL